MSRAMRILFALAFMAMSAVGLSCDVNDYCLNCGTGDGGGGDGGDGDAIDADPNIDAPDASTCVPSGTEVCDNKDNDCNGLVDEASPTNTSCNGCTLGLMGDHAYAYCPGPVTWADARTTCMGFGGDLVIVNDQAEQDFLLGQPLDAVVYIGLFDEAVVGTFVWVDGTAPVFTAWGAGEPNNALDGEDCGQLAVATAVWNDIACATAGAFVCEAVAG